MPKIPISIVIPAFNAAPTLASTINSCPTDNAVAQILVVDDGSSDGTLELAIKALGESNVITGPNRGVSTARNVGISRTSSDWIQFLDSDDLLVRETLRIRMQYGEDTSADVVVTDWADFVSDDDIPAGRIQPRRANWTQLETLGAEIACATSFWAPPAAVLYRRSLVEKINGFSTELPIIQDARFLFDAAFHGAKFVHFAHCGAYYRVLPGSLSRKNPAGFWLDVLKNGNDIENLWRSRGEITPQQQHALENIFLGAANALVRLGHPAAHQAVAHLAQYRTKAGWKLRAGIIASRLLPPNVVRAAFKYGAITKAHLRLI